MKTASVVAFSSLVASAASFVLPANMRIPGCPQSTNFRPNELMMGGPQDGGAIRRPSNEFSRTVPPDKVLKLHGKHQRTNSLNPMQERQYLVEVDASEEECQALASRFQLPDIESIEASLLLSPEGSSGVDNGRGILVEGTAHATVTRICVRTNEEFQENLEFSVYSVVRPVNGVGPIAQVQPDKDTSFVQVSRHNNKGSKKRREKQKEQSAYDEDEIDPAEMLKMHTMLDDLDRRMEEYEDVLFEDEAIFATNGMLDVGELVAQLFWLQLDPYPRKPGGPEVLQFSISG